MTRLVNTLTHNKTQLATQLATHNKGIETMKNQFDTLKKIIAQLELVGYTDEIGHKLEMNAAFIELKKRAVLDSDRTYIGKKMIVDGVEMYVKTLSVGSDQNKNFTQVLTFTDRLPHAYSIGGDNLTTWKSALTPEDFKEAEIEKANAILAKYKIN